MVVITFYRYDVFTLFFVISLFHLSPASKHRYVSNSKCQSWTDIWGMQVELPHIHKFAQGGGTISYVEVIADD